jgi:vacuolar-type H+-ATPase subunit D/Vma8
VHQIRGIRLALEEREREDIFRMKHFKKRSG